MPYRIFVISLLSLSIIHSNAQDFYNADSVQQINLIFSETDWDLILDSLNAAGDGRLLASVEINGILYDSVGVKYKGNSSYQPGNGKNPFNIKLDYVHNDADYKGYTSIKLNTGFKDPTMVREVLGYEIARKYTAASGANYAHVNVNGVFHGLYTNVQDVDDKFQSDHLYTANNIQFKCDPIQGSQPPNGCSAGNSAALVYQGADSLCYINNYELESDYGWGKLYKLINTLNNNPLNLNQDLDVDRALWMLVFNNLLVNLDSYSGSGHNYYLVNDNNDRFNSIVWDFNETFGAFHNYGMGSYTNAQMEVMDPLLHSTNNMRPLIQKLLSDFEWKEKYIAHYRTMLNENFANNYYITRGEVLQDLIEAEVYADPNYIYPNNVFTDNFYYTEQGSPNNGTPAIIGLMEDRITFLQSHSEFTQTPPIISNIQTSPSAPSPNDDVWITATITNTNSNNVQLGYRLHSEDIFQLINMYDDGAHQDGAAGDNIFGASFNVSTSAEPQYYVYARNNNAGIFSPERAEFEFYAIDIALSLIAPGEVVINEFLASNTSSAADQNGEFDDWIELYNNTPNEINLNGKFLSDDALNPDKFIFPDTSLAANNYLIIWLDEDGMQSGLHANFKLSSLGENVLLSNHDSSSIDQTSYTAQTADISYGRYPNGTGPFTLMSVTYSAENTLLNAIAEINLPDLKIYPNPVSDYLMIDFGKEATAKIVIFNLLSQNVLEQNADSESQIAIDVSGLADGIYILQAEGIFLQKIVIAR